MFFYHSNYQGTQKCCRFEVVLNAAGSAEECERIARLCYLEFEKGRSKEDVTEFRDGFYSKHRNEKSKRKSEKKQPGGADGAEVSAEIRKMGLADSKTAAELPDKILFSKMHLRVISGTQQ